MEKEITSADVAKWVEKINAKFGRTATNMFTTGWFISLMARGVKVVLEDKFYIAYAMQTDAWGATQFIVISACSDGTVRGLLQMERAIYATAHKLHADVICIGSEIDDRFNERLVRKGYRPFLYKKEL